MKQDKPSKKATIAKAGTTAKSTAKSATAKKATKAKAATTTKTAAAASTKAAAKPVKTTKAKPVATPAKAPRKAAQASPLTTFVAQTEIGWGNSLYLRGEGAPELSWERGILMKWVDDCWVYSTTGAKGAVSFKFLVNDEVWANGHNEHVEAGNTSITSPSFHY